MLDFASDSDMPDDSFDKTRLDKSFANTKVKINNKEECIKVQKVMFEKGYGWGMGDEYEIQSFTDSIYAIYLGNGTMSYDSKNPSAGTYFNQHIYKEIKVDEILGNGLTDKQKKAKVKKIIDEIKKDKDYFSCFNNDIIELSKEVNSWGSYKLSNWK